MHINIRHAVRNDISTLSIIFNYHVVNGYSSLRVQPETVEQRLEAYNKTGPTGPYQMLVAESEGSILGSTSSFQYRDNCVFNKTVEVGIYLDPQMTGKGIGTALYQSLFNKLANEDIHLAVAGIALPNQASVALHEKVGFSEVGTFDEYAYYRGNC